jgi:7,8-dihydropterin-6-yl-methyl-4-(beta-D-ribofuranosyl)aminobenzene 5'-phosphate synthase
MNTSNKSGKDFTRRDFIKGAASGIGLGALATMGIFSYSDRRKNFLPQIERKNHSFGVCRGV